MKDNAGKDSELNKKFEEAVAKILPATSGIEEHSKTEDKFLTLIDFLNQYRLSRQALTPQDKSRTTRIIRHKNNYIIMPQDFSNTLNAIMLGYFAHEGLKKLKTSLTDESAKRAFDALKQYYAPEIDTFDGALITLDDIRGLLSSSTRHLRVKGRIAACPQPAGHG